MKVRNQYSEYFEEYRIENGEDPYIVFKDENTTEEKKQELIEWLFNLLRTKGEIPMNDYNETKAIEDVLRVSNMNSYDVYQDGCYGYQACGVGTLNYFFPELFYIDKPGKPSIYKSFHDDTFLRRVCKKNLTYDYSERGLTFSKWFILCGAGYCSNFRPATAKAIYEIWGKKENCKVFDSSAGFGARLMGAHFASNVTEYLGIDPNTKEHCDDVVKFLDTKFQTRIPTKMEILKMGSEDFTKERFPQYTGYFDLYFTSPPYFDTEQYSTDESQSWVKFPTYAEWVKGFYRSTIYNACDALKKDGIFIINIFEKIPNIKELTKLFLADKGWYVFQTDKYLMHSVPGKVFDDDGNEVVGVSKNKLLANFEPIWYAKHYTQLLAEGAITEEQAKQYEERVKC